ncbi:hypothetical protein MCNF_04970 [Mycolicibacterium confluentis]|uniref:Uncharacterized protein n=1 Tax=Mycolicibacterium confluentis TaxID=28047 RepID=A0A7I7XSI4_9MYCO|nr:hypothetical protein MCNF_04970 [Mycolicibacterium confluentis]
MRKATGRTVSDLDHGGLDRVQRPDVLLVLLGLGRAHGATGEHRSRYGRDEKRKEADRDQSLEAVVAPNQGVATQPAQHPEPSTTLLRLIHERSQNPCYDYVNNFVA